MTERAASSTAVLVCQGRAAGDGRYAVGRFSDPIARELLDPAERVVVDRVRADHRPDRGSDRMAHEMVRRIGLMMVPRTIAIDEAIRSHPTGQLVILGAGLDARPWRMAELTRTVVFEVDHPASQLDKLRRSSGLRQAAGTVVSVAIDLSGAALAPALERSGFDPQTETTWVWEGVVPYLTADDVRATVAQVAQLSARDSRLVVNYQAASFRTTVLRAAVRLVLRVSRQPDLFAAEPWRSLWRPDRMRRMLRHSGFDVVSDCDLLTLSAGLALPKDSHGSFRNGRVAVAVRR
jgi:methyltransferase (TIGR00027 family)